ncbi:transcriptional repressor DicA [Haploplasma axanthum]|uniref:Transcriptional repressor DicA n=2 Tax=Haploplasma axanthum TaxID=29552 RepID=A0A449BDS0_HAPAX|nr:transcriptional repressor DicA [Haploplasma axanthum]
MFKLKRMRNIISDNRKKLNITQKELAEKINVSDKQVSKWETGVSLPDVTILSSLANALEISVNELLDSTDTNKDSKNLRVDYQFLTKIKINVVLIISTFVIGWILISIGSAFGFEYILQTMGIILGVLGIMWHIISNLKEKSYIENNNFDYYNRFYYYKNLILMSIYIVFLFFTFNTFYDKIINLTNDSIVTLASSLLIMGNIFYLKLIAKNLNTKEKNLIIDNITFYSLTLGFILIQFFDFYREDWMIITFAILILVNLINKYILIKKWNFNLDKKTS